ncbi:MAG TPA: hypothetical protein VFQ61_28970 [Polyangiaceae bacterium]|nr:hypothetical protein [Polyangiaceae bacterium]
MTNTHDQLKPVAKLKGYFFSSWNRVRPARDDILYVRSGTEVGEPMA